MNRNGAIICTILALAWLLAMMVALDAEWNITCLQHDVRSSRATESLHKRIDGLEVLAANDSAALWLSLRTLEKGLKAMRGAEARDIQLLQDRASKAEEIILKLRKAPPKAPGWSLEYNPTTYKYRYVFVSGTACGPECNNRAEVEAARQEFAERQGQWVKIEH